MAGLIVETVQGAGGMQAAAPGFLSRLRRFTRDNDLLLIVDEIFTGFGRTGARYGFEHEGVVPDLVILGKALGGGLPVSVVAGPREIMDQLAPLAQTSTFSANPLACAAGTAVLHTLADALLTATQDRGLELVAALERISVPGVELGIIGQGLMLGAVIQAADGRDVDRFTRDVVRVLQANGVFALRGGTLGNVVKMTPPLTISTAELEEAGQALSAALNTVASSDV